MAKAAPVITGIAMLLLAVGVFGVIWNIVK
jgi:hypothetical protein